MVDGNWVISLLLETGCVTDDVILSTPTWCLKSHWWCNLSTATWYVSSLIYDSLLYRIDYKKYYSLILARLWKFQFNGVLVCSRVVQYHGIIIVVVISLTPSAIWISNYSVTFSMLGWSCVQLLLMNVDTLLLAPVAVILLFQSLIILNSDHLFVVWPECVQGMGVYLIGWVMSLLIT